MAVISFPTPPQNIQSELSAFLYRYRKTTGARALNVLLADPGTIYDVLELSMKILAGGLPSEPLLDLLYSAWGDVPICDSQALREYNARLSQLDPLKAKLLESDPFADYSDLDWEASFLRAEIRNSTKPKGGIKNFRQTKKRAYNRLRLALMRLLKRVDNPLLHSYIVQNLKTGLGFVWLGTSKKDVCYETIMDIAS